ncbi:MAG: hypothetical protein WB770_02930 [Acidimicrobiales bacterium]
MRGRWAAGIVPRNFSWIIKGHLAVSERPGGSAPVHRRVRRQEEILWLRGQGFTKIVSLLPSPHNLHAYEELGIAHEHVPMAIHDDPMPTLLDLYPALLRWMYGGERVLVHQDQLDERLAGVLGGFLYWSGMVPELPLAISAIENLLRRQLGAAGRTIATLAIEIPPPTEEDRRRPERPSEAVLTAIAEGRLGPVIELPRAVPIDEPEEALEVEVETGSPAPTVAQASTRRPTGEKVSGRAPTRRTSQRSNRPATSTRRAAAKKVTKQTAKRGAAKSAKTKKGSAKSTAARRASTSTRAANTRKAAAKSPARRVTTLRGAGSARAASSSSRSSAARSTQRTSLAKRASATGAKRTSISSRASTTRRKSAGNA